MNLPAEYVIGIDIGGTNADCGVVDRMGNFYTKFALKTTDFNTATDLLTSINVQLEDTFAAIGKHNILGVGIGAPAANALTGLMQPTANIQWEGITPLANLGTTIFGVPTAINNDANISAIGELIYGKAIGVKDFIVITLGTGVGSGIVCNGQLVLGHDGFAGELGHWIIDEKGRACGCGRKGCLETYTSATGIVRTAYELLFTNNLAFTSSPLAQLQAAGTPISAKAIFEAAQSKDALALAIFEDAGHKLGVFLANMVTFTSPQKIILFGGLAQAQDVILQPVQKAFDAHLLYLYKDKTTIEISSLDSATAALLGAAALAWNLNN